MNINVVVVIYNLKLKDSTTLSSILNANLENINLTVNVWNNGPELLDNDDIQSCKQTFVDKKIELNIFQDIRNIALSKIYNFLVNKKTDFHTIFDQDSLIENDFFKNILENANYQVIVPKVFSFGSSQQFYPIYFGQTGCVTNGEFSVNRAFTISSGISLSYGLIEKMTDIYGNVFDNRFAFYGVDASFFHRAKMMTEVNNYVISGLCIGKMEHSLAMLNDNEMNEWRLTEVWYDRVLSRTVFNGRSKVSTFIFLFKKLLKREFSFSLLLKLLSCLRNNQHPRSVYQIDKKEINLHNNPNVLR